MISEDLGRGNFSSRGGFILAAAGSAIGLGNIWRFPYTAGENGGGAFVLVYLMCVVLIGFPVMLAELTIGRASQKNPVGAYGTLARNSAWRAVGGLGVITAFAILAFYCVVAGWTLGYLAEAVMGRLATLTALDTSGEHFDAMIGNPVLVVSLTATFLLMTGLVVQRGINSGIESAARILMPIFFALLLLLALRAVTLPGAGAGLKFLFAFDFSKITGTVVLAALGQALFSLSLGLGAMITYGSYLPRRENLWFAGASVAFFDTLIALLAGVIIFPVIFSAGGDPAGGPGLVFVTLPTVFATMPAGGLIGAGFFALLAIAALTSTISLLEVVVAYFVDERGWTRASACWTMIGACFLVAVPSALSQGGWALLSGGEGSWLPIDYLTLQGIIFGNYSLSIGALLTCIFIAWHWGIAPALVEIERGAPMPGRIIWRVSISVVCPLAVLAILLFIIFTGEYF